MGRNLNLKSIALIAGAGVAGVVAYRFIKGKTPTTVPDPDSDSNNDSSSTYTPINDTSFGGSPDPVLIGGTGYGSGSTTSVPTSSGSNKTYTGVTYVDSSLTASQKKDLQRSGYVRDSETGIWYKP